MPLHVATALLAVCVAGGAQDGSPRQFPTGRLIEDVPSASAPDQRFTIYLPRGYDGSRPAPILYLMDPRSRARVPAKLFLEAAERYGYILVSSHQTSSDGPVEPNLLALNAMWADSHAWFRVDDRRVYIAGFSGTARTATLLAHRPGLFTGVISAGAGFHPEARPTHEIRTLYFGTAGTADYNFHEVETLESQLAAVGLGHRVEYFPGTHRWMPPDLALRAVEWMELRAMQAGLRTADAALVETWWAADTAVAEARLKEGRLLDAGYRYTAMARDYAGLRDTAAAAARGHALLDTAAAKQEARRRRARAREAVDWLNHAMQAIANAFPEDSAVPAAGPDDLGRDLELRRLQREASGAGDAALEAQRRLNELDVQLGFYLPQEALDRGHLTRAAYYLSLAVRINESSPVAWYLTAETHARLQDEETALGALRRAIAAGFRDLRALDHDPGLRNLRDEPEFAEIVAPARAQGDTLDRPDVDRPPPPAFFSR